MDAQSYELANWRLCTHMYGHAYALTCCALTLTLSLSHTHIHTHSLPTPAHTQHIRIKNTQAEVEDLSAVACTCITAVGTPASKALRGCSK